MATIGKQGRRTVMIRLDAELYHRLRAIIFHTGKDRTIQSIGQSAIRRAVIDIESFENNGRFFETPAHLEPAQEKPKKRKG